MRVDGIVFAHPSQIPVLLQDQALEQVANVAHLPGIVVASLAMPDIHWGYGFPIGGVAATDPDQGGVVSPGGVGYDINCGVRLLRTPLRRDDLDGRGEQLLNELYRRVPAGAGIGGRWTFTRKELDRLLAEGMGALDRYDAVRKDDIRHTEAGGCLASADPDAVSERAAQRGADQCGTLGSGNHFLEVGYVERIVAPDEARAFGLEPDQIVVLIHSGSRGLGHQVCDETLRRLRDCEQRYGFTLPDRQLACAPIDSDEGRRYLGAMRAAANFAFCNRQLITVAVRDAFRAVFDANAPEDEIQVVYDVAHNIAKFEKHDIDGEVRTVLVHRKGATRAFPPGHPELPEDYRDAGQPVLIPGDMGRASWVLAGAPGAMRLSFGTTCHGAGRVLSRRAAIRAAKGRDIAAELRERGVRVRGRSAKGILEEQPEAYKDVDLVVEVVETAGLSKRVARLRPLLVVKG
ncbi:MAG: RtcB family protein [Candidatus Dadabacteria bacterium]|nr:MAG: RtcB family protein [Candidatus Dadabacteria bacterium]